MIDIDEIRRDNIKVIEREVGSASILAKLAGMGVSQYVNLRDGAKDSKTGKPRGMRKETARKFEAAGGKEKGWLDCLHFDLSPSSSAEKAVTLPYSSKAKQNNDEVILNQFMTGGGMGNGVLLRDQPGIIQSWRVTKEWLHKNIKSHTSSDNLCIVTGFGDSMRPMFNPGDPLIVDIGVRTVDFDAIYFFRVGNEGFIKRLQRIPGEGLRAISTNKEYESWTVKADMDFEVFGRVLKVWCSEEF